MYTVFMPELPEVQTVVCGLRPALQGKTISHINCHRKNLRYDFPENLADIATNATVLDVTRRAKYILVRLSTGWTLISHLGMSGTYRIAPYGGNHPPKKHDHCILYMQDRTTITYNDPRRFGFLIACPTAEESYEKHLKSLGVEPFAPALDGTYLYNVLNKRKTPIKTALLNQTIIAGLGNIYVCEALFRAKIHPKTPSHNIPKAHCATLATHIIDIIASAIDAGGATLRNYTHTDGKMGYFQHIFDVYARQNQPCHTCRTPIQRITQSGRSSFFCAHCQKMT